jgi:hypothetical protein
VRRFAPQLFAQLFCISAICLFVSSAQAQLPVKPNGTQDIQNREWALGNIRRETKTNTALADRERQLARLALQEDFRQLQVVNNSLMKRMFEPVSAAQKITRKEIRSSLGQIQKLVKRLQLNLAIPVVKNEPSAKEVASVSKTELAPGLLQLDKAVMSFVENPLFQRPRVYDPELGLRAGKDVHDIVSLTDFLRCIAKDN